MRPATWPRDDKAGERLLVLDPRTGSVAHARMRDLPAFLDGGDVVVVNDAATLPSRIPFTHRGAKVELRVATVEGGTDVRAILFGEGSPRAPTEEYAPPPVTTPGETLEIAPQLRARVIDVDARHPRLVRLRFDGAEAEVFPALYRVGQPIQYAYVERPLSLFHVQTPFASRPWASEMPSAGRPLSFALVAALRRKGARVVALTHGAGLSSTGDATLDARLPLRERYEIPAATARAVEEARGKGSRVVAIGTSVTRALESSFRLHGRVEASRGWTELLLTRDERPRVVDAILTGMHQPGTSHYALLEGFVPARTDGDPLLDAWRAANEEGYAEHEFGDSMLVVSRAHERRRDAA